MSDTTRFNWDKYREAMDLPPEEPLTRPRRCYRCNGGMTRGFIPDYWQDSTCQEMIWVAGDPTVDNDVIVGRVRRLVVAYRCVHCRTLELVAE